MIGRGFLCDCLFYLDFLVTNFLRGVNGYVLFACTFHLPHQTLWLCAFCCFFLQLTTRCLDEDAVCDDEFQSEYLWQYILNLNHTPYTIFLLYTYTHLSIHNHPSVRPKFVVPVYLLKHTQSILAYTIFLLYDQSLLCLTVCYLLKHTQSFFCNQSLLCLCILRRKKVALKLATIIIENNSFATIALP